MTSISPSSSAALQTRAKHAVCATVLSSFFFQRQTEEKKRKERKTALFFFFFIFFLPCLSAGCADTVACGTDSRQLHLSSASSICYLETSDFITADRCSCTPWLSVQSLRLHVNDRLRLYLIKIWQALSIIGSIASLCLFLPPSPLITKSIFNPPSLGVRVHLPF